VRRLDELRVSIEDVGVRHSSLDDVFFALTGHRVESDDEHTDDDDDADDEHAGDEHADDEKAVVS
jgi:oleandomycin transport system ATP-binding protein